MKLAISLHDDQESGWADLIKDLYNPLGFPHNPNLLPPQFAQVTFPKMGGKIAVIQDAENLIGVGFLFPRAYHANKRTYTLRYHPLIENALEPTTLIPELETQLNGAKIVYFDPLAPRTFSSAATSKTETEDPYIIDRPTAAEAEEIRQVHHQIWRNPPGYLYPTEMHSIEFGSGTSLIARATNCKPGSQIVGFLLGFRRFGGSTLPVDWHDKLLGDWRIESQSMGILPEFRGKRLGYRLKQMQATQARSTGVNIINWTADPLLFTNAALNIGLLRAIAFDFHADFYPFRNELNRVAASRFSLTWLINTKRVRQMTNPHAVIMDLASNVSIPRINSGTKQLVTETSAAQIAIEIPADWSAIQRDNLDEAERWRTATDAIFAQFIGRESGQYVVTDVAVDGPRRYLIGNRVSNLLWDELSAAEYS